MISTLCNWIRKKPVDPYEKERKVIQKKVLEHETKKQPRVQSTIYPDNWKK